MIRNPKVGDIVQIVYAARPKRSGGASAATLHRLHGRIAKIKIVATDKPHNHLVELEDKFDGDPRAAFAVPAKNLKRLAFQIAGGRAKR